MDPQGKRTIDLSQSLDEDQVLQVGAELDNLAETVGWRYILSMVEQGKKAALELVRTSASKDYVVGVLDSLDAIPAAVESIRERARQYRKLREQNEKDKATEIREFFRGGHGHPVDNAEF